MLRACLFVAADAVILGTWMLSSRMPYGPKSQAFVFGQHHSYSRSLYDGDSPLSGILRPQAQETKTLQMLALSGVVRPSHVELRYTIPLLRVEGPTDSFQNPPGPATTQSSLLRQIMELVRRLMMDLQSLRTYLHLAVSSFCVNRISRAYPFINDRIGGL